MDSTGPTFKKATRKRKIVGVDKRAEPPAPKPAPAVTGHAVAAEPAALASLPKSRRKSRRVSQVDHQAMAEMVAARTSAQEASEQPDGAEAASAAEAAAAPSRHVESAVRCVEIALESEMQAPHSEAGPSAQQRELLAQVCQEFASRMLQAATLADVPSLNAVTADTLNKTALVDTLKRESAQWDALVHESQNATIASDWTPGADAPPAQADGPAPLVDLAPELSRLCERAGFRLDEIDERVRWAQSALTAAKRVHVQTAAVAHANAFGGYEHVNNPRKLIQSVAAV